MKVFNFFLSLGIAVSLNVATLNAKVAPDSQNQLSKKDMQALFETQNVNVAVLSQEEMKETKGQSWLLALGVSLGVSGVVYLVNGLVNHQWGSFKVKIPTIKF